MNKNVPIDLPNFSYDYEKYPPIGIDFGTSNSAIAKWVNTIKHTGTRVYTLNDQVQYLMPSFVYLDSDGEFIAGKGAYNKRIAEPDRVAACVKRKISDQSKCIPLADTFFSPIDITAKIIQAILKSCMDTGLEKPAGIVVSVPYYFTQNQNNNIRTAVNQALQQMPQFSCLSVEQRPKLLGLIPEPVAAALSFSIANMESAMDDCVLLYDMGGGTLDISILQLNISGPDIHFEILATDGDDSFGGEDFDHILEQYVLENSAISFKNLDEKLKRRQKRAYSDRYCICKRRFILCAKNRFVYW
ncbi:MAG: Chaperone protein dnaK [Candidatus Magnetoglobus multicellularis str. Araruama]|uniref:Chaperone protein dnaK n=1 Tax=Candidatus Magnetoglobus multicellularis str. Araruama TaxID=890399 RepID=A0A1V1PCU8_9BACT|nr:MAG: Chaperone protein dnaK [Candidatus Magnetoglobus multicellularis str. Araruama]